MFRLALLPSEFDLIHDALVSISGRDQNKYGYPDLLYLVRESRELGQYELSLTLLQFNQLLKGFNQYCRTCEKYLKEQGLLDVHQSLSYSLQVKLEQALKEDHLNQLLLKFTSGNLKYEQLAEFWSNKNYTPVEIFDQCLEEQLSTSEMILGLVLDSKEYLENL